MVRALIYYDHLAGLAQIADTLSMLFGPALPQFLNNNCTDVSGAVFCCLLLSPNSNQGVDLSQCIPGNLPVAVFVLKGTGARKCCDREAETFASRQVNAEVLPANDVEMISSIARDMGYAAKQRYLIC